jgi:N6-adenosine-specific RNA methylase IME4
MKQYRAILADPPWMFITRSAKGKGRSAESWYDCMTLAEIKALPVQQWAAKDCVLLLWTTGPMMRQAFDIVDAWGFIYSTMGFVWAKCCKDGTLTDEKHHIGNGYWSRANPEFVLLATSGNPKRLSRKVRELIVSPRREHSRKPDQIYERVEALCEGPYLELFARFERAGWDGIGNETGISSRRWKSNSYPVAERGVGGNLPRLKLRPDGVR